MQQLVDFYNNHKFWFFALLPLVIAYFGIQFFLSYNVEAGKKELDKTAKEDAELKLKQKVLETKADDLKKQSDEIQGKIDENNEVSEDWYKRK